MLEFLNVPTTSFTNADGVITDVIVLHEFVIASQFYSKETKGKDLDLIAFEELGTEYESLKLMENNAQAITEYDFDMSKVLKLNIPVN